MLILFFNKNKMNYDKIHKDIKLILFSYCDLKDLYNLNLINKKINNALSNIFWRNKLCEDYEKYGHAPKKIKNYFNLKDKGSWKNYYGCLYSVGIEEAFQNEYFKMTCELGEIEHCMIMLIDNRFDPSYNNNSSLNIAIRNNHESIVNLLINDPRIEKTILNKSDKNILENLIMWACQYNHPSTLEILLSKKYKDHLLIDHNCIKNACEKGHEKIVNILLTYNLVDPSVDGNYCIIYSSSNGHTNIVKMLMNNNLVDPSDNDNLATLFASKNGHAEILKMLLSDPRVKPHKNCMYYAEKKNYYNVVEILKNNK